MDMREIAQKDKITKDELIQAIRASAETLYYIANLLSEEDPPRRVLAKALEYSSDFPCIWDPKRKTLVSFKNAPLELLLLHVTELFSTYFGHLYCAFMKEEFSDGT